MCGSLNATLMRAFQTFSPPGQALTEEPLLDRGREKDRKGGRRAKRKGKEEIKELEMKERRGAE